MIKPVEFIKGLSPGHLGIFIACFIAIWSLFFGSFISEISNIRHLEEQIGMALGMGLFTAWMSFLFAIIPSLIIYQVGLLIYKVSMLIICKIKKIRPPYSLTITIQSKDDDHSSSE